MFRTTFAQGVTEDSYTGSKWYYDSYNTSPSMPTAPNLVHNGSVFHSIDTQTGYELLTAPADIRIIRLTLCNVETSDTTVNVNLFKNLATGKRQG